MMLKIEVKKIELTESLKNSKENSKYYLEFKILDEKGIPTGKSQKTKIFEHERGKKSFLTLMRKRFLFFLIIEFFLS
jgi:hypothetical protein